MSEILTESARAEPWISACPSAELRAGALLTIRAKDREAVVDYAHFLTVHHLALLAPPAVFAEEASLNLSFEALPVVPIVPGIGKLMPVTTHVKLFGVGLTDTHIHYHRLDLDTWMIGCNTPIDDHHTEYTLVMLSNRGVRGTLAGPTLHRLNAALIWKFTETERLVWRSKRYLKHPHLTGSERGLGLFRRWAKRFRCV